jgi:hypothetical protein
MFNWIIKKIIGTKNQRTVRKLQPTVAEINRIEALLQNEPEEALQDSLGRVAAVEKVQVRVLNARLRKVSLVIVPAAGGAGFRVSVRARSLAGREARARAARRTFC